jgi:putative ABC transport system permease protein
VKTQLYHIALTDLLWMLIPVGIVVFFYLRWTQDRITIPYALGRMVLQLLSIGYVLVYIFTTHSPWLMGSILMVMLMILGSAGKSVAIYLALRPSKSTDPS